METKNDYLDSFIEEVVNKGLEALLPQNLTDKWLDILLDESNQLLEGEPEQGPPTNLLLAVIKLLSHHKGNPDKFEISDKELFDYIEKYTIALSAEEITRKTDMSIEPPTLNNVLSDDRKIIAHKK